MPLLPHKYKREKIQREKLLDHSADGVSTAMALMVDSLVHMVRNSQSVHKGAS